MYRFNSRLLKLLALEIDRPEVVGIFVGTEQCYIILNIRGLTLKHIQAILYTCATYEYTIVTNIIQMSFNVIF